MSHIFISHVEEDADIAFGIALGLEEAGYTTWCYELDSIPGPSYLIQTGQSIEQSEAVVLVISPHSLGSHQVTREVVRAYEGAKPFIPVLRNITHVEFQNRQPEWREAVGAATSIYLTKEGVAGILARVIDGLKALGIHPASKPNAARIGRIHSMLDELQARGISAPSPIAPAVRRPSAEAELVEIREQLAMAVAALRREEPQGYIPSHLARRILASRASMEGERKQVTVLAAKVGWVTAISGAVDPEEVHSLVNCCLEVLLEEVHRYEGTVVHFTGDGVVALFGAPIAHEDASQRALYAALAIQRELGSYRDNLIREFGVDFQMRFGLNTGPVIVAKIGDDLSLQCTQVDDTIDLATSMQQMAGAGSIIAGESTLRLTEGYFEFRAAGEVKAEGVTQPRRVYELVGLGPIRSKIEAAEARGLTPFVGRERGLELLLDGFEQARAGRGQAFSIMGEAGVGKSRLLYEFRKAIANEDVTLVEGRCLSYGRNVAYHPMIDLLKSDFDIRERDEDRQIRDKVKRGLEELRVDEGTTLPYLLELLSVADSGIDQIPMSPEARKDRMMEALKRIVLKGSEIRPLILAIEDLHWIDRSSEEALKYLLESISGARVLLIFTYRPEFVHTWGGRSYHNQVNLNRLSNRESLVMVTNILGTEEIERELEELILEKTEGVPFFIEEFIKSCKDLGIIERRDGAYHIAKDIGDLTIPGTIQDVIMARVDSLPDAAKGVLQTGSAIEREFSHELIKRVTGILEQELLSHLSVLKDSELLYERGIYPESTYIFKHALTREVVYDSILTARKKRLHVEIGDAIEEICRDNLDEHYAVLAEHYVTGENYEKGAEYCGLAATKAVRAGSINDAIAYGQRSVACLEKLPRTEEVEKKIVDARATLGHYYMIMNYFVEAKEAVDPIVDLALERGYRDNLPLIYAVIGSYELWVEEDYPKAFKYLEDGIKFSEESNDIASLVMARYWLASVLYISCEFEKSLYHFEKGLEITVAANILFAMSVVKSTIAVFVYNYQGKIDLGYQTSDEALQIAEQSGDIYSKAIAHAAHGYSCHNKGLLDEAEQHLLKAVDYCERINWFSWGAMASMLLGDTYCDMADYRKSQDYYGKAISLLESVSFMPSLASLSKIALARAKVMNGEKDINLNEIFKCHESNKAMVYEGWMARYIGEILLNIDDQHMNEAEDWIKKAIEAGKRNGTMLFLGRAYALYAELLKRKGDLAQAKENLNTAMEIFKECGADGWVKKAEKALAEM